MTHFRDNVKQTATHDGTSIISLGWPHTAVAGFRTFIDAFGGTGVSTSGNWDFTDTPVRIDKADSTWGVFSATFRRNSGNGTEQLRDLVQHSSSTGNELTFTVDEAVTVSLTQAAFAFGTLSTGSLGPPTNINNNKPGWHYPDVALGGLMAAGAESVAKQVGSVALGYRAQAQPPVEGYAVAIGKEMQSFHASAFAFGFKGRSYNHLTNTLSTSQQLSGANHTVVSARGILQGRTSDTTPTLLGTIFDGGSTPLEGSTLLVVPRGTTIIEGYLMAQAIQIGTTERKVWRVQVIVDKAQDSLSLAVVGTPTSTVLYETAGATAWSYTTPVQATDGLTFSVVGSNTWNLNWALSYNAHIISMNLPGN